MARQRISASGIKVGKFDPGEFNAITDVAGVLVAHMSLDQGEGRLVPGVGPIRTGVTVISPHAGNVYLEKVPAAVLTLNGYGKAVGFEQVRELGQLESPIALTNTLNVGSVMNALVKFAIMQNPKIGISTGSVNVVVAETNDGYMNDIQGQHIRGEHVEAALNIMTSGPVQEGNVGAGTGTRCFGWKGGIGTASRVLPVELGNWHLGVLTQANFGNPEDLIVNSWPVGRYLRPGEQEGNICGGSVVVVIATNAPLDARQLGRICARAGIGLARTGGKLAQQSGDFIIAFTNFAQNAHSHKYTTLNRTSTLTDDSFEFQALFHATIECVEEAVLNSLWTAETMTGRDDHILHAIPVDQILCLIKKWEQSSL